MKISYNECANVIESAYSVWKSNVHSMHDNDDDDNDDEDYIC